MTNGLQHILTLFKGSSFDVLFDQKCGEDSRKRYIVEVFFNVKGVKQGSTLSPKLFAIFINDLAEYLEKRWVPVVHLGNTVLSLLLFADDKALVARSRSELQTLLDLTAEHLEEKKLEINTKKTKVRIFCRRQSIGNKDEESFNLNGEAVKVVSQAIYLGFHLTSNGRWINHS